MKPLFWKRYVDDVISGVSRNEVEILLSYLNSVESCIKLNVEREKDRRLLFLDLNVYRADHRNLEIRVYRKPLTPTSICFLTLAIQSAIKSS